jgi:hypothetical protein
MKLTDLINEEKYTIIDPKGNPAGTGTKMQANQRQKKLGGSKKGYFVVPANKSLKARRTLEKYKFDFKNPKLQDLMSDLYFESVNEARTVSKPIKVDDDTMVQIVGDNKGFRELTAALNPKTGKPIQKFGYERGNEIADSKEELIKKLQKKYGKSIKFESVNEGRAFVQAARKAKEEGKTEFEFNGKTYPVTLKESEIKLTDLLKEGKFKKEERDLKNLTGTVKIDFEEALEMLEEDGVLEAMEHLENAIERIQYVHKQLKRKS